MAYTQSIAEVLQKAYGRARGKDTLGTPLLAGDAKFNQLLDILDNKQKEWQDTPGVDWNSQWQLFRLSGTPSVITVGTDAYALPSTMRKVSQRSQDSVIVTVGTNFWLYDVVRPDQLTQYMSLAPTVTAHVGANLQFSAPPGFHAFRTGDPQVGGTIDVPGYKYVTTVNTTSNTANLVEVDDPMWLVYAMAAEFVRTDLVRRDQYANLNALAQERMEVMIENNEAQLEEIPVLDDNQYDPSDAYGAWS